MEKKSYFLQNRRQFITKGIGGCALVCLASSPARALIGQESAKDSKKAPHIFDTKFDRPLTYKQLFHVQYAEFIRLAKFMIQELGEEKFLEILKKQTEQRMLKYGQEQAKKMKDNSFQAYVKQFKDPKTYKFSLKKEVVEDTDKVCELKVTECIWATTFLNNKAGKIGFARVCYGDYFWPKGFNPKIKMVRSKTLMQGHDCCNHRYIWEG
jgi:hypothetical protein